MKGIKAKALVVPAKTDLYFRVSRSDRFDACFALTDNMNQPPRTPRSKLRTCSPAQASSS